MKMHAPLLMIAMSLLAGVAVGDAVGEFRPALVALAVSVGLAVLLGRWPRWQTVAIWCCTFLVGVALGSRERDRLGVSWPDRALLLEAVVVEEPVLKDRWVVCDVVTTQHHRLRCRIVRDGRSRRIRIGDGLVLQSRVRPVGEWHSGHFDYRRYMQCHDFVGESFVGPYQWQWRTVSLQMLSGVERLRLRLMRWRHHLLESYRQWGLDGDVYHVVAAMTLGERSQMSRSLKDTYARVGASHVLALSGLHLMILYGVVSFFFGWGRWRLATQLLTVLSIWAFALLTGMSSSVTRSAWMISLYALLSLGHRERMSVNTLSFAAVVMVAVRPYAIYDMGFQLSFMSVLSILLLTPRLMGWLPLHVWQRHRWWRSLCGMVAVSVSAQVGTAPLVAYYFGRFSTYFLLSNMVVVPMAYVVLYLSLSVVVVFWSSALQQLLVGALSLTVTAMNTLLTAIGRLPGSSIEGINLSLTRLYLLYIIMVVCWAIVRLARPVFRRSG